MVSIPAPPTMVSATVLPVMVSLPADPFTVSVSLPTVQLAKLQPDRSSVPPVAMLMTRALVAAVPVMAAELEILPAPNWSLLKVAVEVPEVLAKAMPSMLRKPVTPSDAAPLRSMLVPAPAVPICSVSVPSPPSNVSAELTWPVAVTMIVSLPKLPKNASVAVLPVKVSLPPDPFTASVSVPPVQLVKVQADRSIEPPAAMLTITALVAAVPVTAKALLSLPAPPNWALLNVAIEVPEVLAKMTPSMLDKPLLPEVAAPLKSMLTPALPVAPTWMRSLPFWPSYRSLAPIWLVLPKTKVSAPWVPVTVTESVPPLQLARLQPDMSNVPAVVMLTTRASVPLLPVMVSALEILPAPNWALLNVAVEVPPKVMPSMLRKPFTPSDAAPLKSTLVLTWMTSLPPPPSNLLPATTGPLPLKTSVS